MRRTRGWERTAGDKGTGVNPVRTGNAKARETETRNFG